MVEIDKTNTLYRKRETPYSTYDLYGGEALRLAAFARLYFLRFHLRWHRQEFGQAVCQLLTQHLPRLLQKHSCTSVYVVA
jgi:hypothetical protein